MPKMNIDLGTEMSGPCCVSESKPESKKYYPSFRYDGEKPLKLPHEGEMVIRFKKIASEHRTDSDNKDRYSCTIEVREIVSAYGDEDEAPAGNRMKESEDALDKIRAEKMKGKDEEGEY